MPILALQIGEQLPASMPDSQQFQAQTDDVEPGDVGEVEGQQVLQVVLAGRAGDCFEDAVW